MTVRLGILTCGTIVTNGHLPAFAAAGRGSVDVVAFSSRSRSSAERAASQWGSGDVVDDWRDVLERDDVDAVDICSPNALHAEMAVAAAAAGKHILVEKPMATTLADADRMIDAAAAAGVVLMAAHNVRFAPPYLAAAATVAAGHIGDVVAVRAAFGHAGPQAWAPDAAWFRNRDLSGGGALLDLGIHVADLVRAVTGDEVDEASAFVRRPDGLHTVEESGQVAFRLRAGGIGTFSASWTARPGPDHQLLVHGSDGTLSIERGQVVVHPAGGGPKQSVAVPDPVDPYAAFVRACAEGSAPPVTGRDGRAALAIVVAAYAAAASGRSVAVDHRSG